MPFLDLPGVRMHFTDTGQRAEPTLLLVHGWGGDSTEWRDLAAALASTPTPGSAISTPGSAPAYRIITADLRGHGHSSTPTTGYAPSDFAADLAALLKRLASRPVIAVGHSMGAQVVVALAADHPEAVAALVVLDPAYGADEAELARIPTEQDQLRAEGIDWALRFAESAHSSSTSPAVRIRHQCLMAEMDPRVLAAARDAMYLDPGAFGSRPAAEAKLKTLTQPVLTVMTGAARAVWAGRTLHHPRSRVELFDGCGHYVHEERPEALAALIGRFTGPGRGPRPAGR